MKRTLLVLIMMCSSAFSQKVENYRANRYIANAESGDVNAQHKLAILYETGTVVTQDDRQAVYWYKKAAEQGHLGATDRLGVIYHHGKKGVLQDDRQAVYWYKKAAEQGHLGAMHAIGDIYHQETGVLQDDKEAVYWYNKAAEQGSRESQYRLGDIYRLGTGVLQDDKEAVYWYTKAAEQEHANAQIQLGIHYSFGIGVPQDKIKAYALFLHGKLNGMHPDFIAELVKTLSLTQKQKEEGQQLAKTLYTD